MSRVPTHIYRVPTYTSRFPTHMCRISTPTFRVPTPMSRISTPMSRDSTHISRVSTYIYIGVSTYKSRDLIHIYRVPSQSSYSYIYLEPLFLCLGSLLIYLESLLLYLGSLFLYLEPRGEEIYPSFVVRRSFSNFLLGYTATYYLQNGLYSLPYLKQLASGAFFLLQLL